MVASRGPKLRRHLLPVEVQICESLNLTEAEYWHFCDITVAHNSERAKEYSAVPDIRADPVTWAVVSIVVGIALQVVSALLTPKPKEEQKLTPIQTADSLGRKRFAPTNSFDSVQTLASLGAVVPLVFCRRENGNGGVRVNAQLLWSQLLSHGSGQELRALMLLSAGKLEREPDYGGYALGDNKLENISAAKVALYFNKNGKRFSESAVGTAWSGDQPRYPEGEIERLPYSDPFSVVWDIQTPGSDSVLRKNLPYFSGCRNPSGSTQFGAYAPLPNGNEYKMEFELVLIPRHDEASKKLQKDQKEKRDKVYFGGWAKRCHINRVRRNGTWSGYVSPDSSFKQLYSLTEGDLIEYEIGPGQSGWGYHPWGVDDVREAIVSTRQSAYDALTVGDVYTVGSATCVVTRKPTKVWRDTWDSTLVEFKVIEKGDVYVYNRNYKADLSKETDVLLRSAMATISNNRQCDCTEIGIKSSVFSKIGFANVNSVPEQNQIEKYEDKGGSIGLGRIDQYIKRYSFFRLEIRKIGGQVWVGLSNGTFYCVEGRNPQEICNFIRIYHPRGQYEFRLRPYSGNYIWRNFSNLSFIMLRADCQMKYFTKRSLGGITVGYPGKRERIDDGSSCNPQWVVCSKDSGWNSNFREYGWKGNLNKHDAISDYWAYESEVKSHQNNPEHEVTYVNEMLKCETADIPQYNDLAYAGIRIKAGDEISTFAQFSAFMERGIVVPGGRLIDDTSQATNLLPEIAWTLLTSKTYGLGKIVGSKGVDKDDMTLAAKFCKANGLTWDGVISEKANIREWLFEMAGFCFLDFVVKGGLFSLKPSVMYSSSDYRIRKNADLRRDIKALFTDGNIAELKVTFLSAEERQNFQAVCLWRDDTHNGFPEVRSVLVRENKGNSDQYPEETFDMSGWCTRRSHAIKWAKWAVLNRTRIDHAVTFKTTPDCVVGMEPGDLFRLETESGHVNRFTNGSVTDDGVIQSVKKPAADVEIYYWEPGTEGVKSGRFKYEKIGGQNTDLAASFLRGCLFTVYNVNKSSLIYKCESISYADDGFVELSGSVLPVNADGESKLLDWDDDDWIVEDS